MDKARIWFRVFFLLFSIVRFASAQTPAAASPVPLPKGWLKAASLRPGEPLSVQMRFTRAPTLCTLVWIDNNALACDAEAWSGKSDRLVFPAAQVYSVERDKAADCDADCGATRHMLIGAGVGSLLGGLLLARSSGQAGAVGALLGAGVGAGVAAGPPAFGTPMRPAASVRIPLRRPGRLRMP